MAKVRLNPHALVLFSVAIFLLVNQSQSSHESAPSRKLKESDTTSQERKLMGIQPQNGEELKTQMKEMEKEEINEELELKKQEKQKKGEEKDLKREAKDLKRKQKDQEKELATDAVKVETPVVKPKSAAANIPKKPKPAAANIPKKPVDDDEEDKPQEEINDARKEDQDEKYQKPDAKPAVAVKAK